MTERVTVIVGAGLMTAANHVHVLLGKAHGLNTYQQPSQTDGAADYAVSSGLWTAEQIAGVEDPAIITAMIEAGRVSEVVDLDQVRIAQGAFTLYRGIDDLPAADQSRIIAVVHDDSQAVLAAMGLSPIPAAAP